MIIAVQAGRSPELTAKETESTLARDVAPQLAVSIVQQQPILLHTDEGGFSWGQLPRDNAATTLANVLSNWINRLGGARRLGVILTKEDGQTPQIFLADQTSQLLPAIIAHLPIDEALANNEKLTVGFSAEAGALSVGAVRQIGHQLKEALTSKGVKARVVIPQSGVELSAAAVKHNKLTRKGCEWLVMKGGKGLMLMQTVACYDPDRDAKLDRGIPASDAKSGMLPPKLARMMVNIAAGPVTNPTVTDPFCGNGRVVLEAALLGYKTMGSDVDPVKVAATKKNLAWLQQFAGTEVLPDSQVQVADARRTATTRKTGEMVVVTEPYLGPALRHHPGKGEAQKIAQEVGSILGQAMRTQLGSKPVRAVVVAPAWKVGKADLVRSAHAVLDAARANGYDSQCIASIARDDSFVTREIILITRRHGA